MIHRHNLLVAGILALFVAGTAHAQSRFFDVTIENTGALYPYPSSGVFNTPDGGSDPGPATPGQSFTFQFDASAGSHLSFATMFAQSNDLFYAPDENGIPLWDEGGMPRTADITGEVDLWDAGTEMNQEPGVGDNQAPRQGAPDTGPDDPDSSVRRVSDGFTYPADEDVVEIMLEHLGQTRFRVTIANVSDENTLMTSTDDPAPIPLSPGVFVVHPPDRMPLFTEGEPDRGEGLEHIAEDGSPAALGPNLAEHTGVPTLFSPGVWVVHDEGMPLFESGQADRGDGLERIAEDASPAMLATTLSGDASLSAGVFAVPAGNATAGPILPGHSFRFLVRAEPGDRLSIATMFGQSNDLFAAFADDGLALFDDDDHPVSGSVADRLDLWDAGTEANEVLGVGANQAPRQPAPDTGPDDPDSSVRTADTDLVLTDILDVRIEPVESVPLTLTIENVSTESTLMTSGGAESAVPVSPGVWVVHTHRMPLFENMSEDYGRGLERIAEDANPVELGSSLAGQAGVGSGIFNTPVGEAGPGPITPGEMFRFDFDAAPGARLSVAMMFGPSNDGFYAPDEDGIRLWDEFGNLRTGDLTTEFRLWDAGTEMNEEPGAGDNQAATQDAPDTGPADADATVRLMSDGYSYPETADVLRITLSRAMPTDAERRGDEVPSVVRLHQNYPNPFNPETTIRFDVERAGPVRLSIHDILGREVTSLLDGRLDAGSHRVRWDGRDASGSSVASGVYFVRMTTGSIVRTRSMTLLR